MSVINQMLQDLEKRRASGAERGALPNQVRVLPRAEERGVGAWLIGIAIVLVIVALLAWQFKFRAEQGEDALASRSQEPQSSATTLYPGAPVSRLALDLQKAPLSAARSSSSDADKTGRKPARAPAVTESGASAPAITMTATNGRSAETGNPTPAITSRKVATVDSSAEAAPATRVVELNPDSGKAQSAPSNSQIDKRAQTLTVQQRADNEYREGANYLTQGRLADAQEAFRQALRTNPAHVGARQGLFGLLLEAKKPAEAEQLLQDGLKLNVNQPGFAIALSSLQYERGNVTEAIETMQRSAPAAQSSPDYLARLAGLLQRQGRHAEAIQNYQAAVRLAPGSGVWLMGMGISLQALNRTPEAQEAFRRARDSNTLNPELTAFVDQRLKQLQ